uniref:Formin 1 n=1 Tax=Anolis carolinensis TaxID=28377 RepID=A0A803TSB6_ANOCA
MEGTHTILQLHRPVTEICYVSFCLPRGKVRGFTYKGCVTLDKSNKCFLNCYQVRESSDALGSRRQTCEDIGDIFFKQTTTKDILTELYKLNAEKEKLLTNLLNSSQIVDVEMGNQDGKLQDISENKNNENLDFWDQQESFSESIEKKSTKTKKARKPSKRRESIEDFINKRIKRKISGVLESSALNRREVLSENNKLLSATCPADVSSSSFVYSYQENLEDKDNLSSDVNKRPEQLRRQWPLLEKNQAFGSDSDISISISEYDNDVTGHCFAHSSHSLLDDVDNSLKEILWQQSGPLGNSFQEAPANRSGAFDKTETPEMLYGYNHTAENCKSKPENGVASKEYETEQVLSASVEYGQVPSADRRESKASTGSVFSTVVQEKPHEDYIQQHNKKEDVIDESSSLIGAVNKTILKVIQSDKLVETATWKRLPHITKSTGISETRPVVPPENSKYSSLHLPIRLDPDICQTRTSVKQEDKKPPSPSLAAVSNVFNNSYPSSNTHKQMSPLPSPLSSCLPSPQLHHRILPLPALGAEEESVCSDDHNSRYFGANLLSVKDLEAQLHLGFSECGHSGLSMRQPGLDQSSEFELKVFHVRGEYASSVAKLEDDIANLKNELDNKLCKRSEEAKDVCVSTEDDHPPKSYRNVCIQTDRETFIKPTEDENKTVKNNQIIPKKLSVPFLNNSVSGSTDHKEAEGHGQVSGSVTSPLDQIVLPPPPPPPPPPLPPSLSSSIPPPPALPGGFGSVPPPPPPPLPAALGTHVFLPSSQGPRKPTVEPSCPMKPLYWNRIQIKDCSKKSAPTLWESLEEPNICDTSEFEYLFSKETAQERKKPLAESYEKKTKAKKLIKLLDGKRSQAVGILISSLHLEMKDIQQAVLNVDDSIVDLEILEALYENRAQKDELEKIKKHYATSKEEEVKLLDKPEQFLYELSQIPNFAERARCIIFQSVFNEGITAVHRKVDIITIYSQELLGMKNVKDILGLILAFGNYMNGGNRTRGQADGFGLEILPNLKDVKSRDSRVSLVDYVVMYYLRHFDKEAGTDKSEFPLPEPQDFFQASQVKFEDLIKDLKKMKKDLEVCEKQMKVVFKDSPEELLQPFKDKLETFFLKAVDEHKSEESHLENVQKRFEEIVDYFGIKPKSGEKEITPNYVFMVWYEFCSDFKTIWKRESKNISKERLKTAQESVSKLTAEKKVETKRINPTASLVCCVLTVTLVSSSLFYEYITVVAF